MAGVLILLLLQGLLGAFDTLWYHERVAALPLRTPWTAPELRLHAARDLVYGLVFLTLPFFVWSGWLAWVLVLLLACEIGITLAGLRDLGAASGRTSFKVPFLSPRGGGATQLLPVDQRRISRS